MQDELSYRMEVEQIGDARKVKVPDLGLEIDVPEGADAMDLASRAAHAEIMSRLMRGEAIPVEAERQAQKPVARGVDELPGGAMTLKEAQERLGVSQSAVSKLISRGRLEAISYDGRKYVTPEAIDAYEATGRKRGRPIGYSPADAAFKRYCDQMGRERHDGVENDRGER